MKRFSYDSLGDEDASVNLTPLIDIVFVILMAFMIAVPLLRLDSISLASSSQDNPPLGKEQQTPIVIKVFADHSIQLNDQLISLSELQSQLGVLHQQHPHVVPLLLQDGDTPFRYYQTIKSTIESAGFRELHIALQSTPS